VARDVQELRAQTFAFASGHLAQHQLKAVAAQVSHAQFVAVPTRVQHAQPVQLDGSGQRRLDRRQAQPLAGRGIAVLHARVAHVPGLHAQRAGQARHCLKSRQAPLFDPHEGVGPFARRQIGGQLLDEKSLGRRSEPATK